jgi:unsaturated rhamnogalacturonyl hydrolase
MKCLRLLLIAASCHLFAPSMLWAEATPTEIVTLMERVADWQFQQPSKWKPLQWHHAVFYSGVMALTKITAAPRFLGQINKLGEENQWQLASRIYHADDHTVGQTYAELYLLEHDDRKIAPMRERFDFILAQQKGGSLAMDKVKNPASQDRWSWCDALFMAPPAWIRLAHATGNRSYLDFAVSEWWVTSDYLYNKDEHLYFRDSSYFDRKEKNGRKIFWGRGNGWVMAGLVRMLQFLPSDHVDRPRFVAQFREMAETILTCQQSDGFWRASLLDPASYPMQETSGTGLYCYAFAWGVNEGLLERARFAPSALRAWAALTSCVTPEGKLTHVQPVGAMPHTFDAESNEPFGAGAFLLAGSEVYRLIP